ncbi:MAG: hypothetical protein J6T38_07175 [Bacteroidaceae bacterium]|nr:hypothetical protein [Bacteroidaceae bacterium]
MLRWYAGTLVRIQRLIADHLIEKVAEVTRGTNAHKAIFRKTGTLML